jgi:hypothetical protein
MMEGSRSCEQTFTSKNQKSKNSQILLATQKGYEAQFWYSKVELDHLGTRSKDAMF